MGGYHRGGGGLSGFCATVAWFGSIIDLFLSLPAIGMADDPTLAAVCHAGAARSGSIDSAPANGGYVNDYPVATNRDRI
jgi:hypothetical protein